MVFVSLKKVCFAGTFDTLISFSYPDWYSSIMVLVSLKKVRFAGRRNTLNSFSHPDWYSSSIVVFVSLKKVCFAGRRDTLNSFSHPDWYSSIMVLVSLKKVCFAGRCDTNLDSERAPQTRRKWGQSPGRSCWGKWIQSLQSPARMTLTCGEDSKLLHHSYVSNSGWLHKSSFSVGDKWTYTSLDSALHREGGVPGFRAT